MKQNSLLLKRGIAFLVDLYIGALLGSLPISIISLITIKQMTQNIFLLNHQIAIIAALLSLIYTLLDLFGSDSRKKTNGS